MRLLLPLLISVAGSAIPPHCSPEGHNSPGATPNFGLRREVEAPSGYNGPIDPEWPPRRAGSLEVEIAASRLVRARLETHPNGDPAQFEELRRGIHVERGQIGVFHYLEVIVGRPKHPDDPLPLVIVLHGRGNRPQIPNGPLEGPVPFRMFIPQAPDALGDGFTWLAVPTLSSDGQLFTRSLSGRVDQLAPAIEAFVQLRPTLGKPILVGFSQGAIMTFTLATRYPSLFAAAFPIAGWLPPELYPTPRKGERYPYFFAQHGGADTIVPTIKDRETVTALRARGLRVDYKEAPGIPHVVSPEMSAAVRSSVQRILRAYQGSVRKRRLW